jgi:proline iminopeptidase
MSATSVLPAVTGPPAARPRNPLATAAGWSVAALSGIVAAAAMPRGPATTAELLGLLAGAALAGGLTGTLVRTRWAVPGAPLLHLAAWELARATVFRLDGPTFDRPRFDVSMGVLLFVAVHVMYALVAGLPMAFGVVAGRAVARGGRRGVVTWTAVLLLLVPGMAVLLLRSPGVAPAAVAELVRVPLGGGPQWVSVRGGSADNPVLLHLSGGPGSSDVGWVRTFNRPLEDRFTVAVWEQRGVGKSYDALDPTGTLTLDRLVADGIELSAWLARRYGEAKIYLTGNSWGSTLGVLMVQRRPDLFHAYVGTGQMVSQRDTDRRLYRQLSEHAARTGDERLRDRLAAFGEPPYADIFGYAMVMEYYDVLEPYPHAPAYENARGPSGFFPDEYRLLDTWNEVRGFADMGGLVYPQLQSVDFRTDVPRLDVPVYIARGGHELTARDEPLGEWLGMLRAPVKRVVDFPASGHNPDAEEPDRFHRLLIGTVLPETYPPPR